LDEGGQTWDILATLQGASLTTVFTRLGGEDKKAALRAAIRVQEGLGRKDYHALLGALDAGDGKLVHGTDLIEKSILAMLYDMKFEHPKMKELNLAIIPHKSKIEGIVGEVARSRSIDVTVDRTHPGAHDQLVDYVSRVARGHGIMTANPKFWKWLEGYPGIDRLLSRNKERRMSNTNSLVRMLSVQFMRRESADDHMGRVNSICQGILDSCDGPDVDRYEQKVSESYDTALAEMKAFLALKGEFQDVWAEEPIPRSKKNADLCFRHDGEMHYVEVYTPRKITLVGSLSKYRVDPKCEWKYLFKKRQIVDLKAADARTVFVMDVGSEYFPDIETRNPEFKAHVCAAMPEASEVVIIRSGDVEALSIRGGQVVATTGLGRALASAIGNGWE